MSSVSCRVSNDIAPFPAKPSPKMSRDEALKQLASLMATHAPTASNFSAPPGMPSFSSASAPSHFGFPSAFPTGGASAVRPRGRAPSVLETLTGGVPITVSDLRSISASSCNPVAPPPAREQMGGDAGPAVVVASPDAEACAPEPRGSTPTTTAQTTTADTATQPATTSLPSPDGESPSLSRAEQSRRNGAKSRGPTTAEGKAASSRNAFKHGFRSQSVLIPGEDPAAYEAFLAGILNDLQPVGTLQSSFARRAAEISWRLERLPAIEAAVLAGSSVPLDDAEAVAVNPGTPLDGLIAQLLGVHNDGVLLQLQRYEVRLERSLSACLRELRILQGGSSSKGPVCGAAVPAAAGGTPAPQQASTAPPTPRSPGSASASDGGAAVPAAAGGTPAPQECPQECPQQVPPQVPPQGPAAVTTVSGSFGTDVARSDTLSGSFGTEDLSIADGTGYTPSPLVGWTVSRLMQT